jgi:putative CocE/NonD family hydrolase
MISGFYRCVAGLALGILATHAMAEGVGPEARFGSYRPDPTFDGKVRQSHYVTVRDGTRLAVDVYLPTRDGQVASGPLPVVWNFTPYNRATRVSDGTIRPTADMAMGLLRYGFAVAVADVRGKGASFGTRIAPSDQNEASDAYDIIEWLAAQPWSNGKVGMMGCSYTGATTLAGLRSGAPHLKAVFVGSTMFDQYGTFAQGGIPEEGLADESTDPSLVVEVDEDKDRKLVNAAVAEQQRNTPTGKLFGSMRFRDDISSYTKDKWWQKASFYPYVAKLRPDIGVYLSGGTDDVYSDQTILTYMNLKNPKKLVLGRWPHCDSPGFPLNVERLRFFDHWLKGVQNGIMNEPPVHVYVTNAADGTEWRALPDWPADAPRTRYYLAPGAVQEPGASKTDAVAANSLVTVGPRDPAIAPVELTDPPTPHPLVVYATARGAVDPYSAVFSLPPQEKWREIIGSAVARLWVSSTAPDVDVYVYLEAVHSMGGAQVIGRGVLRASHRKLGQAPYFTGGLPWQTHLRADQQPLVPNQPVPLDVVLSPTTHTLKSDNFGGDLLRLVVTTRSPTHEQAGNPPPLRIYMDAEHPSYLEVPGSDTRDAALTPDIDDGRVSFKPEMITK